MVHEERDAHQERVYSVFGILQKFASRLDVALNPAGQLSIELFRLREQCRPFIVRQAVKQMALNGTLPEN